MAAIQTSQGRLKHAEVLIEEKERKLYESLPLEQKVEILKEKLIKRIREYVLLNDNGASYFGRVLNYAAKLVNLGNRDKPEYTNSEALVVFADGFGKERLTRNQLMSRLEKMGIAQNGDADAVTDIALFSMEYPGPRKFQRVTSAAGEKTLYQILHFAGAEKFDSEDLGNPKPRNENLKYIGVDSHTSGTFGKLGKFLKSLVK